METINIVLQFTGIVVYGLLALGLLGTACYYITSRASNEDVQEAVRISLINTQDVLSNHQCRHAGRNYRWKRRTDFRSNSTQVVGYEDLLNLDNLDNNAGGK